MTDYIVGEIEDMVPEKSMQKQKAVINTDLYFLYSTRHLQ